MADSVLDGFGCFLKIAGTKFAASVTITLPKRMRGKFEITKLDQRKTVSSVEVLDKEKKFSPLSLIETGDLIVEAQYTPSAYAIINAEVEAGKKAYEFSDNQPTAGTGAVVAKATFNGFVTEISDVKREMDKPATFTFTVCVADTFVFNPGTEGS